MPFLYDKEDSIGFLLHRTSRSLVQLFNERFAAHGIDLRTEHWAVLYHVFEKGELQQQELMSLTCTDKTALTRAIDHLVEQGLVQRREMESDRRKQMISISPLALQHKDHFTGIVMNEIRTEACRALSQEEQTQLKQLLNKIYFSIQSAQAQKTTPSHP
jgi:DNA-binding MarR family transcriptional regulator